jgi:hypothetical protein
MKDQVYILTSTVVTELTHFLNKPEVKQAVKALHIIAHLINDQ